MSGAFKTLLTVVIVAAGVLWRQPSDAATLVTYERWASVSYDHPYYTTLLTNLVSADPARVDPIDLSNLEAAGAKAQKHLEQIKMALDGSPEEDLAGLVEDLRDGTSSPPIIDGLGELTAGDFPETTPGRPIRFSFLWSIDAPQVPLGEVRIVRVGPLRYVADPSVNHLVIVDVTPILPRGGHAALLFAKPSSVPPGFHIAGVSLASTVLPEPASWILAIGGFGLVGVVMRRSQAAENSIAA